MKIVLDIQDSKAEFILNWLKQYSFVKIQSKKKSLKDLEEGLRDALTEVKEIEAGRKEAKKLKDFLDEL